MSPRPASEGVAIIGMACRFPGASDHHAFWRNLRAGTESITTLSDAELIAAGVPPELLADPNYVKASPLLPEYDCFDARFFEYSPREAAIMDPQQRLLLEVAWEAFEDAGEVPYEAASGPVGVYVGSGGVVTSYLLDRLRVAADLPGDTGGLAHLGNDKDFPSTRISYKLGLTGPSINVQTACSTSMVAVHLACQSILSGECDMALAGSATVRVPHRVGYRSVKGGIQSPDGHCRAFDAAAQGTVFGSGVGAVLLKEVGAAIADGNTIHAVIRGTAVNNDGADKVSFTASSVAGQARAMVEAMAMAGVSPDDIGYVECHGTGTLVGDPLEIEALSRAFGRATRQRGYCAIGSVKTNIGHLEQTAGVAALIKTALILRHGQIPPSLNFDTPNPKIAFAESPFFVNTIDRNWPDTTGPRRAAVNSLGLGGTNAFAILEQPPVVAPTAPPRQLQVLTLSARDDQALAASLIRHRAAFDDTLDESALADACYTLNVGRWHHARRFAAAVGSLADAQQALLAARPPDPAPTTRRLAFLFSGQGSQYAGMGAELYDDQMVFRDVVDRCAKALDTDPPLQDVMFGRGDAGPRINQTAWTQPALFVLQVALTELWRSWGIEPDVVIGHSIGEFAAACCAGALDQDATLALVAERGRLMQALPPTGAMAAIFLEADRVSGAIADIPGVVAIAGMNGPSSTVVSGTLDAVSALTDRLSADGVRCQRLNVSHAFHSPLIHPVADMLATAAGAATGRTPARAFVSTVTGGMMGQAPDADYWVRHALGSIRFSDGMRCLAEDGATDFVEIGPGGTLLALGRECIGTDGRTWLASLVRGRGEAAGLAATLARLYERGYAVDWRSWHSGRERRRISLPTYPFERRRFWLGATDNRPPDSRPTVDGAGAAGLRLRSAMPDAQFETTLDLDRLDWLNDHRIYSMPVLPTTVGLVILQDAARRHFNTVAVTVDNTHYGEAIVLPEPGEFVVQTILTPVDAATAESRVAGTPGDAVWRTHMMGLVRRSSQSVPEPLALSPIVARCRQDVSVEQYYYALCRIGLDYGPAFRGITELWHGDREALTRVMLPGHVIAGDGEHPALLDSCLHIYPMLADDAQEILQTQQRPGPALLPVSVERFSSSPGLSGPVWCHAVRRAAAVADGGFVLDLAIYHDDGRWAAAIEGLTVRPLPAAALSPRAPAAPLDWLYAAQWDFCLDLPEPAPSGEHGAWLILADRGGVGKALASQLAARGETCKMIHLDDPGPGFNSASLCHAGEFDLPIKAAIDSLTGESRPPLRGIVHLWSLDLKLTDPAASQPEATQKLLLGSALTLLQAAIAERTRTDFGPRLWLVSRNAQDVGTEGPPTEVAGAGLWGFGRTIGLEHPSHWGGLIDLDPAGLPEADAALLLRELCGGDGEDQMALRSAHRFALRLVRAAPPSSGLTPFDPAASYLISGGLGALGMSVARWMITQRGVRHLVLVSRRGETDPAAEPARSELTALGAEVEVAQADMADARQVRALIDRLRDGPHPLKGVFHCAGLLDDGVLSQMDWPRLQRVLAPKLTGGWNLHAATIDLPLDHFVLFSSILGVMGSAGQANYAAANSLLDALAAHRRRSGLAALSLAWGPWADAGIATASGDKGQAIWRARGTTYISSETGWQALDKLVGGPFTHAAITLTQWPVFVQQFASVPPLYRTLTRSGDSRSARAETDIATFRARLRSAASIPECRDLLIGFIGQQAMSTMAMAEAIDPDRPLREYGLDSLMSITLLNRLEAALDVRIAAETMIEGPSVVRLAETIVPRLSRDGPGPRQAVPDASRFTQMPEIAPTAARWLVVVGPRAMPRCRLFCFPFAGGGSAVFRGWAETLDPSIEVVAVEPPGRLARIREAPVSDITAFVDGLMPELSDMLDKPFAFFGHCLGGLTAYETVRRLIRTDGPQPTHLFVSGARPPDRLSDIGPFEKRLTQDLLRLADFRISLPPHLQPDDVFTEIIRHFEIATSKEMLSETALRDLMLPVIRAEFAMAGNFVFSPEAPWEIPITCFAAKGDPYVSRRHALGWGRFTNSQMQLFIREGKHFAVVEDKAFINGVINREMLSLR